MKKLQIYGNTKLSLMPLLPILCACENVDLALWRKNLTDGTYFFKVISKVLVFDCECESYYIHVSLSKKFHHILSNQLIGGKNIIANIICMNQFFFYFKSR